MLLKHKADINAITATGKTALMFAIANKHEQVVALLATDSHVHINQADQDGFSALLLAAELGEDGLAMMKILLDAGADTDLQTNRRKTALKIACTNSNIDQINLLLDYNCTRRPSAFNLLKGDCVSFPVLLYCSLSYKY
jgi:ankyrin repeat protein